MSSQSQAKIIPNPGKLLKARIDRGSGQALDQKLLTAAEMTVAAAHSGMNDKVKERIAALLLVCDELAPPASANSPALKRAYLLANDLAERGEIIGYRLISRLGQSLAGQLLGKAKLGPRAHTVMRAHVDGMRAVIAGEVKDDGGAAGEALLANMDKLKRWQEEGGE